MRRFIAVAFQLGFSYAIDHRARLDRLRWFGHVQRMEESRIPKRVLYMNLGTTKLRGRPRNRWQDVVREDGRIVGGEGWQEKFKVFRSKVLQHTNTTLKSITQQFIPLYIKINVV